MRKPFTRKYQSLNLITGAISPLKYRYLTRNLYFCRNAVQVKFATSGWDAGTEYDEAEDDDNKLPVVCKYYSKFPGMFLVAYGGEDVEVS